MSERFDKPSHPEPEPRSDSFHSPYFEPAQLSLHRAFPQLVDGLEAEIFEHNIKLLLIPGRSGSPRDSQQEVQNFRDGFPEKEETLRKIFEETDRQGIANYTTFAPTQYEGVLFPYTRVSVNDVADKVFPQYKDPGGAGDGQTPAKKIQLLVPGWGPYPSGNPFTPWDMAMNDVMNGLPHVVGPRKRGERAPEIEIYSMGSPNTVGGRVTPEWVAGLKRDGFDQHGRVTARFIGQLVQENRELFNKDQLRIDLQGMSNGAIVAESAARMLPESYRMKHEQRFGEKMGRPMSMLRLQLDNPVGLHNRVEMLARAPQTVIGYVGEGIVKGRSDPNADVLQKAGAEFYDRLPGVLNAKGIDPHNDPDQLKLKQEAGSYKGIEMRKMLQGGEPDKSAAHAVVVDGRYDLTRPSIRKISEANSLEKAGKNPVIGDERWLKFPVRTGHFIDWFRVKQWSDAIDYCR